VPIVIADDHERERAWLKDLILANLPQLAPVVEASNGSEAVALVRKHKPTLVFLDIGMPVLSGIKAAEQIIEEFPKIPILILTNHSDEVFVRKLWRMVPSDGAFAYLLKDSSDRQVIDATEAVLGGDCWIHPRIQRIVRRTEDATSALTEAEFEVLGCIAMGFTDKAIAKRLYITDKAVQARLKCLYSKLGIAVKGALNDDEYNHRCRALNIAVRRGLVNRSELEDWEMSNDTTGE
jgi:DNA-binding NarL/FixJ family response regulator